MISGTKTMQSYIDIAKSSKMSLCVLDRSLVCVYGNGIIKEGAVVAEMLRGAARLPIHGCYEDTAAVGDDFYYVRIYSISDDPSPEYYLCETIDSAQAWGIFHIAAPQQLAAVSASLKYNANVVCKLVTALERENPASEIMPEFRYKTSRLLGMIDSFGNYIETMLTPEERVLFDVGKLCERICCRCNNALAPHDRCISMPLCEDGLYIYADGRRAVMALLNAVFNALVYYPANAIPTLVAYCDNSTASVVIKLTNVPFEAAESDSSVLYGPDLGLSTALVKRFATLAGGRAEIVNGTTLFIFLPAASDDDMRSFRLEQNPWLADCAELDGYIDDFMAFYLATEVRKKTGNIQ